MKTEKEIQRKIDELENVMDVFCTLSVNARQAIWMIPGFRKKYEMAYRSINSISGYCKKKDAKRKVNDENRKRNQAQNN